MGQLSTCRESVLFADCDPALSRDRFEGLAFAIEFHWLVGKELAPPAERDIDIFGSELDCPGAPTSAFCGDDAGARSGEGLVDDLSLIAKGTHHEFGQRDREHRGVLGLDPARLVPCDA